MRALSIVNEYVRIHSRVHPRTDRVGCVCVVVVVLVLLLLCACVCVCVITCVCVRERF